jgi:hypothetical protein
MLYQWEEPFIVDDRRFRKRFEILPVPWEPAARATVEWAKETFGPARARVENEAADAASGKGGTP